MNWHHEEICKELTDIFDRKNDNLIINIPPRHSKTTMSCYFTAWSLARNPRSLFLYISGSEKLTNDNSRLVRSIITHPIYSNLFGVSISADTQAKNHWRTSQGGGITTATINGQITGFGAGNLKDADEFYGAIIIDDPNKINTADSIILSSEPNERFNDTIRSRRNSTRTPIIVIQQRVFENDLSGFLLAGGGAIEFKHISFPVINADGNPLWSARMSLEEIEKIRANPELSIIFDSQYMQDPKTDTDGLVFPKSSLKRFKLHELTDYDANISNCDVADAGDCYLSHPFLKIFNKVGYVFDVVHSDKGDKYTIPEIVRKIQLHGTTFAMYEANNQGGVFASWIAEKLIAAGNKCVIWPYNTQGHKDTRINSFAEFVIQNFRFLDETEYTVGSEYWFFMKHLTSLRKDGTYKLKDAGDAISSLAKYCILKKYF